MRRLERGTYFPPARSKFWPGSWICRLRWLRRKSWRRGVSLTWPGECLGWCQLASWESGVASGTRSGRPSPCGGQLKTCLKSDPNPLISLCFSNYFTQIWSINLCSLRWRYRMATVFWRSGLTEQKLWVVVRKWLEMILQNLLTHDFTLQFVGHRLAESLRHLGSHVLGHQMFLHLCDHRFNVLWRQLFGANKRRNGRPNATRLLLTLQGLGSGQ